MKVTVYDVDLPDREVRGDYVIDTTFGAPSIGDELRLLERHYNPDRPYFAGTVTRRQWLFPDREREKAELRVWVQRHSDKK